MLTIDHITAFCRKGALLPLFVQPGRPQAIDLADRLIAIYSDAAAQHLRQHLLTEQLSPLLESSYDPRFAKALNKLLQDRCVFSVDSKIDYPALRARAFAASAEMLKSDSALSTPEHFKAQVFQEGQIPLDIPQLYGDLPENNAVTAFEMIQPAALIERYNTAVIQAILLEASSIEITISSTDQGKLRRFFTYLKFFKLLATITSADDRSLSMTIDGPASILEQTRRYGLQLATFFPVLCTMETWSLKGQVAWHGKPCTLAIDQNEGLTCPYHNFSAFIPEEIKLFQQNFQQNFPEYSLTNDVPYLRGAGREFIIPDLSFTRKGSKRVIHIELFSKWHRNGLLERLAWLQKHPKTNLIIGVDKALLNSAALKEGVEASEAFQRAGFLFRDYPAPSIIRRTLHHFLNP